jgi:hypothetical protein
VTSTAGVVACDVEMSELVDCCLDEVTDSVVVADVGWYRECMTTFGA